MCKFRLVAAFFICSFYSSIASDLVETLPLTDKIIMLRFDDGYVLHAGSGEERDKNQIFNEPLDVALASNVASYKIYSTDDEYYKNGVTPVQVGRKSKGDDFSRIWPPIQPHIMMHEIFLVLPKPMQRDYTYVIKIDGVAKNVSKTTLTFNEFKNRSEAIHVNQIGYNPQSNSLFAYVSYWMGDMGPLDLSDYNNNFYYIYDVERNEPVWVGKLELKKRLDDGIPETNKPGDTYLANFTAADVYVCDMNGFGSKDGKFVLVVEGIGHSFPFEMGTDIYREAFYTTCRGLYHERAGIELKQPYTRWVRGADHNGALGYPLYYTSYRFMDSKSEGGSYEKAQSMVKGKIEAWGWYHDAGDWDGYPTHMSIASHLMTVFEFAPDQFTDGELNIPESGNGIPDILDEASWLLNYFRRTRHLLVEKGYGTGGVAGARVHGDYNKKPAGASSFEDDRPWYLFGEESQASYRYAGQSAQYAYCMSMIGQKDSAKVWEKEAREVYKWAINNTLPGDDINDDKFFAAAWLFKLTGEQFFHNTFVELNMFETEKTDPPVFLNRNYAQWAVFAYTTTNQPLVNKVVQDSLRSLVLHWADQANVIPSLTRGFGFGIPYNFPMLVGHGTTPMVFYSVVAYELSKDSKYLQCIEQTANYMLGGNPLNMVWVTGLGDRSPREILHIDSWYDGIDDVVPGQVPYGPHKGGNRGGPGFNGPWDSDLARATVYPDVSLWPGHELYFENRYCPITNEYTVHQNIGPAAAIYGYLCGKK